MALSTKKAPPPHASFAFVDFIKSLSACKSKKATLQECIFVALYVEMLGHQSFPEAYPFVIKMASSSKLAEKRLGYLAMGLMLRPTHELSVLTVATLQKDLNSSNYVEVCLALTACRHAISGSTELRPLLSSRVGAHLQHPHAQVRKHAILTLQAFALGAIGSSTSSSLTDCGEVARAPDLVFGSWKQFLEDVDPGVSIAAACYLRSHLSALASFTAPQRQSQPQPQGLHDDSSAMTVVFFQTLLAFLRRLVTTTTSMGAAAGACLSSEYEYQGIYAPWAQLLLLQLLLRLLLLLPLGNSSSSSDSALFSEFLEVFRLFGQQSTVLSTRISVALAYEFVRAAAFLSEHTLLFSSSSGSSSSSSTTANSNQEVKSAKRT